MDEFVVDSKLLRPRKLYISKNIIRIDCPRESLTIISKKPFNQVTCFNSSSKRLCEADSAIAVRELRALGVFMAEAGEVKTDVTKVGPETVQGVNRIAYKAKVTHTEAMPNKARRGGLTQILGEKRSRSFQICRRYFTRRGREHRIYQAFHSGWNTSVRKQISNIPFSNALEHRHKEKL